MTLRSLVPVTNCTVRSWQQSRTARAAASPASSIHMRARICDLLGKKPNRKARVVTFSHRRIHKVSALCLSHASRAKSYAERLRPRSSGFMHASHIKRSGLSLYKWVVAMKLLRTLLGFVQGRGGGLQKCPIITAPSRKPRDATILKPDSV